VLAVCPFSGRAGDLPGERLSGGDHGAFSGNERKLSAPIDGARHYSTGSEHGIAYWHFLI